MYDAEHWSPICWLCYYYTFLSTHELTEKIKMERYELMTARLAMHQPQVEMESCIRAIRAEINQAVKTAFKEAFDKHSTLNPSPTYSKDKAVRFVFFLCLPLFQVSKYSQIKWAHKFTF